MAKNVVLAVVLGAHGLKGEVRVKTFTRAPELLGAYGPLKTVQGLSLTVADIRAGKTGEAVVRFESINERDGAEALKGAELCIARDALPPADSEEFYHADLVGLSAEDVLGRHMGIVQSIHNFGAGDVIEIAREDGDTVFLPFSRDVVTEIDLQNLRIIIAAPEDVEAETMGNVE